MKYLIEFRTRKNRLCRISIGEGEVKELIPTSEPLKITIDDEDFLYTPTRFSTAKICIVTDDFISDLFATQYKQKKVEIRLGVNDKDKEGEIIWLGYLKPEIYTQGFANKIEELELECISAMSVLEYIPYTREEGDVISIQSLLDKIIKESGVAFDKIVYPSSMQLDLTKAYVTQQNFFDEDGKAMTCREVLEEICKLFSWTCCDWNGTLYFVDYDTRNYKNDSSNELVVQDVGFAGSDQNISIVGGYNKVKINCSSYGNEKSIVPELQYDSDVIGHWERDYTSAIKRLKGEKAEICRKDFLKPSDGITLIRWKDNSDFNKILGATLVRANTVFPEDYDSDEKETQAIQLRIKNTEKGMEIPQESNKVFAIFESDTEFVFPPGTFIVNFKAKAIYSDDYLGNLEVAQEWLDMVPTYEGAWDSVMEKSAPFVLNISVGGKCFKRGLRYGDGYHSIWEAGSNRIIPELKEGAGFRSIQNTLSPAYYKDKGVGLQFSKSVRGKLRVEIGLDLTKAFVSKKFHKGQSLNISEFAVDQSGLIGYFISDFSVKYVDEATKKEKSSQDTSYENVINGDFINPLDDIELKINTYNNDGLSYAKLMSEDGFIEQVKMEQFSEPIRLEEAIISRIINQYKSPRIKISEDLSYTREIKPTTIMYDRFLVNKKMVVIGGEIEVANEKFNCLMLEHEES